MAEASRLSSQHESLRLSAIHRIVTDRDTGKQKGFAFLEFFDTQTAESAIRNLNEHDLNGRKLKVHFAANDMDSKIRQGKGVLMISVASGVCPQYQHMPQCYTIFQVRAHPASLNVIVRCAAVTGRQGSVWSMLPCLPANCIRYSPPNTLRALLCL